MQALHKLSTRVDRQDMQPLLVNILLRLRPCFEKESAAVRSVSMGLYGALALFADADAYKEQLHTNLVSLVLHTYDPCVTVQTVRLTHPLCVETFICRRVPKCGPWSPHHCMPV